MRDISKQILDYLPDDGSKVSGGMVRDALELSKTDFTAAKQELRAAGMIETGRGRGGTLRLIIGATPPAEPKKLSKAEIMAGAREAKEANKQENKKNEAIKENAMAAARKEHPKAKDITVTFNAFWVFFEIDGKMFRDHRENYE